MKDWAPIIAALVAVIAAITGYLINGRLNRLSNKTRDYAEALKAIERYTQLPYTIYRRHDSTPETRAELARMIGETQETLAFYRRWLDLDSPAVGAAYNKLIDKIRETNKSYRQQALAAPPASTDVDIELDAKFPSNSQTQRAECIKAMRRELQLIRWPSR